MSLKIAAMFTPLLALGACSQIDYVVGEEPFINVVCGYSDLTQLISSAEKAAGANNLSIKHEITSREYSVFSVVMWKKDFNILLSGIPESKSVHFTALKRGNLSAEDRQLTQAVQASISARCKVND